MLKDTKLSPDFPFVTLAEQADGLSGSDLKELCRNAAMVPVREFMRNTSDDHDVMAKGQLEVNHFLFHWLRSILLLIRYFFFNIGFQPTTSNFE